MEPAPRQSFWGGGTPQSPTVGGWEKMSPYDTLPLPPGDAPKGEATSIKIAKIADAEG